MQPGNFSFGEHFVFEELIGQSKHSEVCCLRAGTQLLYAGFQTDPLLLLCRSGVCGTKSPASCML